MMITHAKILNIKGSNGLFIYFQSQKNVNTDSFFSLTFNGENQYFEVTEISANDKVLEITAKETGYYASQLKNKKDFDIRDIIGLPISLISDEAKISKIKDQSGWC